MTGRRRWWIAGAVVVALLAVALLLWWQGRGPDADLEFATVRRGDFEALLVEDGRTRARWTIALTAPVSGTWTPQPLRAGDTVAAAALLGTLGASAQDPQSAQAARARVAAATALLDAARAARAEAASALREAQRARERAERLLAAGGVSEQEAEHARTVAEASQRAVEAAEARVAAATQERAMARAFLPEGGDRPVELRAPAAGVLLRVDAEDPRVVPAGAPLLLLGATGAPEIVAQVLSSSVPRVALGQPFRVLIAGDTLRGRVTRIEAAAQTVRSALGVEEQRVNVIGVLDEDAGPRAARLGHDYQVEVHVVTGRLAGVLLVPAGALVRDGAGWQVYVREDDGALRARAVTVLGRGATDAAVEGLPEGARVVLYPPESLRGR